MMPECKCSCMKKNRRPRPPFFCDCYRSSVETTTAMRFNAAVTDKLLVTTMAEVFLTTRFWGAAATVTAALSRRLAACVRRRWSAVVMPSV